MSKVRQNNENLWKYEQYKELEKLFAWAWFYRVNRHDSKYAKIQIDIENMRKNLFNN